MSMLRRSNFVNFIRGTVSVLVCFRPWGYNRQVFGLHRT